MKKRVYFVFTSLFIMLASGPLQTGWSAEHPCKADADKFCAGVEPGHGRLRKCLKKHKSEISEGCQAKLKEAKQELKKLKKACKEDRKRLCKNTDDERGSIIQCLNKHESEISAECRMEIQKKF